MSSEDEFPTSCYFKPPFSLCLPHSSLSLSFVSLTLLIVPPSILFFFSSFKIFPHLLSVCFSLQLSTTFCHMVEFQHHTYSQEFESMMGAHRGNQTCTRAPLWAVVVGVGEITTVSKHESKTALCVGNFSFSSLIDPLPKTQGFPASHCLHLLAFFSQQLRLKTSSHDVHTPSCPHDVK